MRKVFAVLTGICVICGVVVMMVGIWHDWIFRPSHAGTIVAWVVGFVLLITIGGLTSAALYDYFIERVDDKQHKNVRASTGSGGEHLLKATTSQLAARERRLQKEQLEQEEASRKEDSKEGPTD